MLDNISTKLTQDKHGKQKEEKLDKPNYWNLYRYNIVQIDFQSPITIFVLKSLTI